MPQRKQPTLALPTEAEVSDPAARASAHSTRHLTTRQKRVFAGLALLLLAALALFLTWDVNGHWDFALPRRSEQVVALTVVGIAIATSTVVFQTLTANRILTPSIMGFDALYVLVATALVFLLGSATVARIDPLVMFAANTVLMMGCATALYRWILGNGERGLYTLILVGVVAGTFFSSLTNFMFRTMDPNEFDSLMSTLFASFNAIDTTLLGIGGAMLMVGIVAVFRMAGKLDVLSLGRERAITLGLDYHRTVTWLLLIIALLVSVSTALVGPITFLGLLVANLAYQLTRTHRHVINLAVASLVAIVALVAGQAILEHVLDHNGTLGSIINVVGGLYFIGLLLKEARS
ncbi:iron chelate uptake ABC transporter family permease subunit [Demequina globuliformis]|uniref:iron chelate uptake ABC transporter family permease subunit n=1 Tax=Demequina globuliformis TaxID=676202 RepID=UPI0009FEC69A|nr:iron chelate uptake ABC transporter family permease subunit [Demequina globuliformis]